MLVIFKILFFLVFELNLYYFLTENCLVNFDCFSFFLLLQFLDFYLSDIQLSLMYTDLFIDWLYNRYIKICVNMDRNIHEKWLKNTRCTVGGAFTMPW